MRFCVIISLFLAVFTNLGTESAKILSIFSMPSPSHYIFASALLKELANKGHEITSVNTYPQKKPIKNFRDIFIENNTRILEEYLKEVEDGRINTAWNEMISAIQESKLMCTNIFENPEFRDILKFPEGKFDLILVEVIWSDSLYGLGQHFNAPMIGVSTFGTMIGFDDLVGNSSPNSIVPSFFESYGAWMSLFERIQNFISNLQVYIITNYNMFYAQKGLYEKYFPHAKLSFSEARTNFSLMLLNQHHSLSFPRPYVTNMIDVGGLHISRKTDPLPEDLQQFLDNATDGVVYFSMGSNVKSKDFPPEKRDIFLNVFRSLKQKVLWKFEDPELPNKPENVFIKPWIPQHAVLAHPNVKVFMTHGGLLSTTEALFFGKPILGIPMFGDQPKNIGIAVKRGFCLSVNFPSLTEEELGHTLNELLNNPQYSDVAKTISSHYHDQPLTPMETAVYWVEYILKHGGNHLRNAGADMNIWQYYSVDVIGFLLSLIILTLLISYLSLRIAFACMKKELVKIIKSIKVLLSTIINKNSRTLEQRKESKCE